VAVLFFMPVFPTFMLIDWLDVPADLRAPAAGRGRHQRHAGLRPAPAQFFVLALPASLVFILVTVLLSAGIRWAFCRACGPGAGRCTATRYLAKWLVNQIQEASLAVLHGIYATVYSAAWYRLLGAKVGKETELSTALGVVPDMLTLGDGCFIADAVMLGDEHIDGGWMTVQPTVIERRSFIGNGAYVPDGTTVPENVLIGVLSAVPRNASMQGGDTWLGAPPCACRARGGGRLSEHLTFAPRAGAGRGRGRGLSHRRAARAGDCRGLRHRAGRHAAGRGRPLGRGGAGPGRGRRAVWHGAFGLCCCSSGWPGATANAPCPCGRPSCGCPRPPPTCTKAWPCPGSCATCAARPG
jgi:non-ribosomal peptide synthetase-like protein